MLGRSGQLRKLIYKLCCVWTQKSLHIFPNQTLSASITHTLDAILIRTLSILEIVKAALFFFKKRFMDADGIDLFVLTFLYFVE